MTPASSLVMPSFMPSQPAASAPAAWTRSRRLALREFGAGDQTVLVRMHRDARLRAQLVDDYPLDDPRVAQLFLDRIGQIYRRHEGMGIWHATMLTPRPQFAGWFNLMPMADRPDEVEIGSRLLPAFWGSGLAIEGGELLLDHAFDKLGLASVWGTCHPGNRGALLVLATLGFEPLGLQPYGQKVASHFRIDVNAWRDWRNTPRRARLRRAVSTGRGGRQGAARIIEEECA